MSKKPSSDHGTKKSPEKSYQGKPLSDKIGSSLKQLYDDVLKEDVPDEFLALLAKADEQDK